MEAELQEALYNAQIKIETKQGLFLRLSALNYLNALVKKKEYKGLVNYGMIKSNVIRMVIELYQQGINGLCEEIGVNLEEDCLYVRCYGVQYSYHHVNTVMLTTKISELDKLDMKWDGVRLQPVAKELYELSQEAHANGLDEETIRNEINEILK